MVRIIRRIKSLPIFREKLSNDEIVVGLVGYTGSGMSTFVHEATGLYKEGVGKKGSVRPFTKNIELIKLAIPGIPYADLPLVFVDTPGMEFNVKSDEQSCVDQLKNWLKRHGDQLLLSGLLYLHRIDHPELKRRTVPFSRIYLKDLCSSPAHPKNQVFLVSTHWPSAEGAVKKAESDEKEILSKYWKHLYSDESAQLRFITPDRQSAWRILMPIIEDAQAVRKEKLQIELRELDKSIKDTRIVNDIRKHLTEKEEVHRGVHAKFVQGQKAAPEELERCARLKDEGKKLWDDLRKSKPGGSSLSLRSAALRMTLTGIVG